MNRQGRKGFRVVLAALAVLLAASPLAAFAQSPNTGTLVVVAVDQTGAVLPGAQVELKNSATGEQRHAVTGGDGIATVPALALNGSYELEVSEAGFKAAKIKGVVLRPGETATVRATLKVDVVLLSVDVDTW